MAKNNMQDIKIEKEVISKEIQPEIQRPEVSKEQNKELKKIFGKVIGFQGDYALVCASIDGESQLKAVPKRDLKVDQEVEFK